MKARSALTLLLVGATLPALGATLAAPEEASVRAEAVQTVEAAPAQAGETAEAAKTVRVPPGDPLLVLWADPERVLGPGTDRLCAEIAITNERICVCECECSGERVRIRCDSNLQDCSKLDGATCEPSGGGESTLASCRRLFVKP